MCKRILLIVICFSLLSCSTVQLYKGSKLAPEEVVVIEGESLTNFSCHMAVATNSIKICAFDDAELDTCQRSVEFLPGEHSFRLVLSAYGITIYENTYRLEFDAGERYCLSIDSYNGSLSPTLSYLGKYNKQTTKIDLGRKYIKLSSHIDTGAKQVLNKHPLNLTIVAGTAANSELQSDITQQLFIEASKYYPGCEHKVVKAEKYITSQRSVIANEMGGEVPELEERLRAKDQMLVEKWFVKSCKSVGEYEVLLLRGIINGTDIMVMKLEP